ncbi:non-ribosomal peptide synthetase [Nocardia bhagyanarayanae]|uniref:Amino acid adenylation domain-containing protein n=1 Tax=Nocardia bhagyanarayanae TaxID=1215925 RepID=A0A543FBA2_9NOCA|nr:non-ribosomal peptide synthetase [Nocardia bhagyanarayanae]TQM31121.1 amino acid adenylation domain-containing protein [Nocardia bhagyanarayanae]
MNARPDTTGLSADEKRELLRELLRRRARQDTERDLSHGERGLWLHSRIAPDSSSYNLLYAGRIHGSLDRERLGAALTALATRHEPLRTVYRETPDGPVAYQKTDANVPLHTVDASTWHSQRLDRWLDDRLARPIDLANGPLLEATVLSLGPEEHMLVLSMAHIAVDFWSFDILIAELAALYIDPANAVAPADRSYGDYVRWQQNLLNGPRGQALREYWVNRLAGAPPRLDLPGRRPRPATQTFAGRMHAFEIDEERTAALRQLAKTEGVTLQISILAAFVALLHRYSGSDDIVVGSPIAGRGMPGAERMIGYFVNAVALRSDLASDPSYSELLQQVRRTVLEAVEHQDYPFTVLAEQLVPVRDPAHSPIFQVFFAWETSRASTGALLAELPDDSLRLETSTLRQGGAPLDLMLMVAERERTLSAVLQYNTDLFDASMIRRLADHFAVLLDAAIATPHRAIGSLPILTPAEVLDMARWNATRIDEFQDHCLPRLIRDQVLRSPHATAVSFRGKHVSYRDLQRRAEHLAGLLQSAGVRPGEAVGIALQRSEMSVIGAYAALLAGGAFLPVDPRHPAQRLRTIASEARVVVWITDDASRDRLPSDARTVNAEGAQEEPTGFDPAAASPRPGDAAYVMFTSGSTGIPKGVVNTHRGICNRLLWMQREYPLSAQDSVLHKTPATFDVSVWELFWPLVAGARVVVAEPDGHLDAGYLAETIVENEVTVVHFVPSMLRIFLADMRARQCTGLRRVITSGEALTADLRDEFFGLLPASLHNLYGPTEAAIDVTYYDCRRDDPDPVVPIGRPIANTRIHLLDRHRNPVPIGVTGELYIGGIGVAKGYVSRPELTAERFVEDPWAAEPGVLLYRTGDLARFRPDGAIEYLGRADQQVKIRGVRIEPAEVEAALSASSSVREAVVVADGDDPSSRRLVAYVVPADLAALPTDGDLRALLRERLPDAMVPAHFVPLDRIPTTPSGKRDYRALPEPPTERPGIDDRYQPPEGPIQIALAGLWQKALRVDRIGADDDFFELGGSSTQIMEICTGAGELGITVSPETLFRHRTISAIARSVEDGEAPRLHETSSGTALVDSYTAPAGATAVDRPVPRAGNTVIESIGVYLPDNVVSTEEILAGCARPVGIPLAQLTGIRTRRRVGPGEFSIDLALRAAHRCLSLSRHTAADIDLLICTNISKIEGPDHRFVYEPSSSMRLRTLLALDNALSFDISNACAGMFTGISVADGFLRTGRVRRAMVVSGEYISHIIDTAQREIVDLLDDRLACLTVGDAGAALILERGTDGHTGFHDLRLRSLSKYSDLCIGRRTDQPHGGAIMHTKAVEQTAVAVRKSIPFAAGMLSRHGWSAESVDHILVHQTSKASIDDASATINRLAGRPVAHPEKVVYNLAERGNTASTTHFVAIHDLVRKGSIRAGDRMLFGVTGSGQTVGAALYTFDDLPNRMRGGDVSAPPASSEYVAPKPRRVRIEAIAIATARDGDTAVDLAVDAGSACLAQSTVESSDIGLLLYAGMLRDGHMIEPATATFVASKLHINDDPAEPFDGGTLAFDVMDGATGFLAACHIAATAIGAGDTPAALVVAAEADPDVPGRLAATRGIVHGGSALLLTGSEDGTGFTDFHFATYPSDIGALSSYNRMHGAEGLQVSRVPALEDVYLARIGETVAEFLAGLELSLSDIGVVCGPQISTKFLDRLAERIDVPRSRVVDVTVDGVDLFTSSIPAALRHCRDSGFAVDGDVGLIVAVGAGIRVGCAIYRF